MIDTTSEQFRRSLIDAAAWWAARSLGSGNIDPIALQQRRAQLERATQLWQEAQSRSTVHLKISETSQYRDAMTLLQQVRDSLGPLDQLLRSAELEPDFPFDGSQSDAAWADAVTQVIKKRSALVASTSHDERPIDVHAGRLLLYWPRENLACGAAQCSSNGFFDVDNVPPWDIWVGYTDGALMTWVPTALIEAAQMGIDANPEQCIHWAD